MSDNITKRVGLGTAYGFAKAGGYEGTVAEFTELLGNIAIDLARIENLSVTVTTLPAGSQATASLNGSVLSLGIPKGDKGDKGNTGDTGAPAGFGTVSATVDANIGTPSVEVTASGADTAKNFAFAFHNLKGQKGDKGDTGEVSEAELAEALEDFSANGTVANAEQLTTDIRANDQTPYLFRTAGGSVDIGDREYINGIVGGTVAWNQKVLYPLFDNGLNFSKGTSTVSNGVATCTADGTGNSYAIFYIKPSDLPPANHVIFMTCDVKLDANNSGDYPTCQIMTSWSGGNVNISNASKGTWKSISAVVKPTGAPTSFALYPFGTGTTPSGEKVDFKNPIYVDLTQMFGSTIADYIYSLEQATAGAGVAWFKKLFNKPYYAYNAGELKSVSGLVSHDMTGFNQFDKSAITANTWISDVDGSTASASTYNVSAFIRVLPNTSYYKTDNNSGRNLYYDANKVVLPNQVWGGITSASTIFTTPANAHYVRFTVTDTKLDTFCVNLAWDNSRNGEYEPYELHSYPLDDSLTLRGIPKISNGSLYYDGDTYESDGTVTRKYGVVDLGTLTWIKNTNTHKTYFQTTSEIVDMKKSTGTMTKQNTFVCSKYLEESWSRALDDDNYDKYICVGWKDKSYVSIADTSYASSDASAFKTAMSGVYLVYELATPTTETADPYTNPQIVNDFGTEEYVIDSDTFAVPVGHDTDYPVNLVAKLEMAPNSPEGNGDYIVRQTNGTNEYVPLVIEDALPTIPSAIGSYSLTVTVAEGSDPVLAWTPQA